MKKYIFIVLLVGVWSCEDDREPEDCAGVEGGNNICGCTDSLAINYNNLATYNDESCEYDTTPPNITITFIAEGSISEMVSISCVATDNEAIEKVELWINGEATLITDNTEPYSLDWNTAIYEDGSYVITVRSYDSYGNFTDSEPISLTIDNSTASSFYKTFNIFSADGIDSYIVDVLLTNDNHFLLLLRTGEPGDNNNGDIDNFILKIDQLGNIIWISNFLGKPSDYIIRNEIYGYSFFGKWGYEFNLIKLDFEGNIISSMSRLFDNDSYIINSTQSGYYIQEYEVIDDNPEIRIIELDSELNIISSSEYGHLLEPNYGPYYPPFKLKDGFLVRHCGLFCFDGYLSLLNNNLDSTLWTSEYEGNWASSAGAYFYNDNSNFFWIYSGIIGILGNSEMKKVNYSGSIDIVVVQENSNSYASTTNDNGFVWIADGYFEKYDYLGNLTWSKNYSDFISRVGQYANTKIIALDSGCYILFGTKSEWNYDFNSGVFFPFIAKTDVYGNIDFDN